MTRKFWLRFLKISLTVAAILLIARTIDFKSLIPLLKQCRWEFLVGSILTQVATSLLVAWRWRLLWNLHGLPLRKYLYFVYLGYFFTSFLPSSATSEAIRVLAFGKKYGAIQESIGVNLVARGLGFFLQMVLALVSIWIYRTDLQKMGLFNRFAINQTTIIITMLVLFLVSFFVFKYQKVISTQKWIGEINRIRKDKRTLLNACLVTALIQIVSIFGFWLLFMSLYPLIQLWQIVLFPAIIQVILMLPISFGGVGLREYLNILFFSTIAGVPKDIIFALSILGYVPILFMAFIGWLWMLFRRLQKED